jgi:hypothetical protein
VLGAGVVVVYRDGRRAGVHDLQPGRVVTAWVGPTELRSLPPWSTGACWSSSRSRVARGPPPAGSTGVCPRRVDRRAVGAPKPAACSPANLSTSEIRYAPGRFRAARHVARRGHHTRRGRRLRAAGGTRPAGDGCSRRRAGLGRGCEALPAPDSGGVGRVGCGLRDESRRAPARAVLMKRAAERGLQPSRTAVGFGSRSVSTRPGTAAPSTRAVEGERWTTPELRRSCLSR